MGEDNRMKETIRVAVTGAAGNIGYALLWRIASGDCFGANQPATRNSIWDAEIGRRHHGIEGLCIPPGGRNRRYR